MFVLLFVLAHNFINFHPHNENMCAQASTQVDSCDVCGKAFKQIQTSDPRKGYDVVQEDADG